MNRTPMERTLRAAALATGGTLVGADAAFGADVPFGAVSSDSRTLPAGALFVALRGPNHDGGDYVAAAAAAGACGAIVARRVPVALPQVVVGDTLQALQALGRQWRASLSLPVVAVAGSNGKTTTKEMIAAILARRGPCLATRGNLNNHIGVPLTLLRIAPEDRSAVIEMGANRVGDVAELMALVRPDVALITNAGAEHLEGFGDLAGVARGEGEAVACLAPAAIGVINADDAYAAYWRSVATCARLLTFGVRETADFRVREVRQEVLDGEFLTRFVLESPAGAIPVALHAGGAHNVHNAAAAAAAASAAGATPADIGAGLADFRPVAGRLQLKPAVRGGWIIDDSYNANPSSVHAGLDVLGGLPGERWLVLGEMAELGEQSAACHTEIGAYARARGVTRLFAVGAAAQRAVESFGGGGEWFADVGALIARLQAESTGAATVLVKGSRVNRLERVVSALVGGAGGPLQAAG